MILFAALPSIYTCTAARSSRSAICREERSFKGSNTFSLVSEGSDVVTTLIVPFSKPLHQTRALSIDEGKVPTIPVHTERSFERSNYPIAPIEALS